MPRCGHKRSRYFSRPRAPLLERFEKFITFEPCLLRADLGDCWVWTGVLSDGRYANFGVTDASGKRRNHRGHGLSYSWWVGEVPEGLQLDHLCRVTRCVNPWHVEPVTGRENTLRADGFAAENASKTHCINGHAFDFANTYTRPDSTRGCRRCRYEANRRWQRENHDRYLELKRDHRRRSALTRGTQ